MKEILQDIFLGIALLGLFLASLAIITMAIFACIIGNITGTLISIIAIFGIWTVAILLADKDN